MWRLSMGNRTTFIFRVIGVLVFMSMVQAQDNRGTPGVDYPNYFTIPETSFKCSEQKYNPGFYADTETQCQAFHFCYQDRQETFLCPTGTIFHQAALTCDEWQKSNCSLAPIFYSVNVGPVMERAGKNLPMLLRLRNRSRNPFIPPATVVDKIALHETGGIASETSISEDETNKSKIDVIQQSSSSSMDSDKDEQILKEMNSEEADEESYKSLDENTDFKDEEIDDANIVYDPVSKGYYRDYDQYEADSEPVSEEFGRFYDYRNTGNEYGSQGTSESQFNYGDEEMYLNQGSDYPEFEKRSIQIDQSLKRIRRKPVYIVLDDEQESEAEINETGTSANESDNTSAESISTEDKETNEYVDEEAQSPEQFPRPTLIPPHQLERSTETLSSEEFEEAIFTELVAPHLPGDYGHELASTYPQTSSQETSAQQEQSDDEAIYIENDIEPEDYEPYGSQYENVEIPKSDEEYEQSYSESSDQPEPEQSDTEDTFVVIPDEYDSNANEGDWEMQNYPEENAYREVMLSDNSPYKGYENYDGYTSSSDYPEYYERAPFINEQVVPQRWFGQYQSENFHPDMAPAMYQNLNDQSDYEYQYQQPLSYESSSLDDAELYSNSEELAVTESPLPVTEEDLDNFSTEDFDDVNSVEESYEGNQEPDEPEDVYYVLDLEEEQSSDVNDTKVVEEDIELESSLEPSAEQTYEENPATPEENYENKQVNLTNEESTSTGNVPLDTGSDELESAKTDNSKLLSAEYGKIESPDSMKSNSANSMDTLSNFELSNQPKPPAYGGLPSIKAQSMGGFDYSTDSRFLNNMGYSESMDFGPYGFGPTMEQQFSMLDSMPQSKNNPFLQRMGQQTEQPKLSPLSAIQEKVRSMKQGKFGAFKKYMSSTGN